jgi:hypothetical protein
VVERDSASPPQYAVRHLKRFPIGTAYAEIVEAVANLSREPTLKHTTLLVDLTGIGNLILRLLHGAKIAARIVPITITAGQSAAVDDSGAHQVPKKDLVTCLQLLLQGRRLKIAKDLPDADLLLRELQNFRMKTVPLGNDPLIAWREGQHDDLVLAVALACWWAERYPPWGPNAFGSERSKLYDELEKMFPGP